MNAEINRNWLCPLLMIYTLVLPSNAISCGEISTVRLVGGAVPSEGRLEVLYNGTWGTVCDDFFSTREGSVVCRQLNYIGVLSYSASLFGDGEGPIWLDNVDCSGSEDSILDCHHNGFGVHNCHHTDDIGIICDTQISTEEGAIRLAGGDSISNGRVEIFHSGEWGTVCDREWDIDDARVVCRQLGFQGASDAPVRSYYGAGVGTIWLSNVRCTGSESRLDQCDHSGWGVQDRPCYHPINDASVQCEGHSIISTPPSTASLQIESCSHTTTYEIAPSSTTMGGHTIVMLPGPSQKSPTATTKQLASQSLILPVPSSSPTTLPTSSDVGDDLSPMELILGLVALGVLLLTSTAIVITVCICRSKRSKSVRVEDFQSLTQSVDFSPIGEGGLVGSFEDSEVVLTNAHT